MSQQLLTCGICDWVHFGVSREHAEAEIKKFNDFYNAADVETQWHYGRPSSIKQYSHCNYCGALYTKMRPYCAGDCPDGGTLGPILNGS